MNRTRLGKTFWLVLGVLGFFDGAAKATDADAGVSSLVRVLRDRPQLQPVVEKGGPIWTWLEEHFVAKDLSYRVEWDSAPTLILHTPSESSGSPNRAGVSTVRVNPTYEKGEQLRPAEPVLCNLVYELNNVRYGRERQVLQLLAATGEIERDDYIRRDAALEYSALRETEKFYSELWVPYCQNHGLQADPKVWLLPIAPTFEEWLAGHPRTSWYPWQVDGLQYDAAAREERNLIPETTTTESLAAKATSGDKVAQEQLAVRYLLPETGPPRLKEAFEWMKKSAMQGDVLAERHLQYMYLWGLGTVPSDTEAAQWILKAAQAGDPKAQLLAAACYHDGVGVPVNHAQAASWYQKAADQDNCDAQSFYAIALLTGDGVTRDEEKGIAYMRRATRADAYSRFFLADCYAKGNFVPKDLVESYKWCLLALTGERQAYDLSVQIKTQLSPEQIKDSEARAHQWQAEQETGRR